MRLPAPRAGGAPGRTHPALPASSADFGAVSANAGSGFDPLWGTLEQLGVGSLMTLGAVSTDIGCVRPMLQLLRLNSSSYGWLRPMLQLLRLNSSSDGFTNAAATCKSLNACEAIQLRGSATETPVWLFNRSGRMFDIAPRCYSFGFGAERLGVAGRSGQVRTCWLETPESSSNPGVGARGTSPR